MSKAGKPIYIAASTQISSTPCIISGIYLSAAADAASLTVYDEADNSATAGAIVLVIKAPIGTTVSFDTPISLRNGCYVATAGTSEVATIVKL